MDRYRTRVRFFAAALSGLAGYVDAVGFVQSKGFFVSFMSGNSTRLGVGIAGSLDDALAAAGLITSFILGVTAGVLVGASSGRKRAQIVLASIAGLLALAGILGDADFLHASLAVIALAMGAENAILAQDGKVRVGLTYVTGSVVKFGQALANTLSRAEKADWLSPLLLWGGFLCGAVAGATAAARLGFDALWLGAGLAGLFALVGPSISASLDSPTDS